MSAHAAQFCLQFLSHSTFCTCWSCDEVKWLVDLGRRRRVDCQRCDGPAAGNLLLSPLALASGRDGALYIGDYNYIRRLSPGRDDVATILQLRYALIMVSQRCQHTSAPSLFLPLYPPSPFSLLHHFSLLPPFSLRSPLIQLAGLGERILVYFEVKVKHFRVLTDVLYCLCCKLLHRYRLVLRRHQPYYVDENSML